MQVHVREDFDALRHGRRRDVDGWRLGEEDVISDRIVSNPVIDDIREGGGLHDDFAREKFAI